MVWQNWPSEEYHLLEAEHDNMRAALGYLSDAGAPEELLLVRALAHFQTLSRALEGRSGARHRRPCAASRISAGSANGRPVLRGRLGASPR